MKWALNEDDVLCFISRWSCHCCCCWSCCLCPQPRLWTPETTQSREMVKTHEIMTLGRCWGACWLYNDANRSKSHNKIKKIYFSLSLPPDTTWGCLAGGIYWPIHALEPPSDIRRVWFLMICRVHVLLYTQITVTVQDDPRSVSLCLYINTWQYFDLNTNVRMLKCV